MNNLGSTKELNIIGSMQVGGGGVGHCYSIRFSLGLLSVNRALNKIPFSLIVCYVITISTMLFRGVLFLWRTAQRRTSCKCYH